MHLDDIFLYNGRIDRITKTVRQQTKQHRSKRGWEDGRVAMALMVTGDGAMANGWLCEW